MLICGQKLVVKLANGSTEEADLVIGADHARSVVRRALFKDDADVVCVLEYE
jgi:2-polyprenyl-6-methoxyphenol hydroxylase-like FAD-dependent oxidoreductase